LRCNQKGDPNKKQRNEHFFFPEKRQMWKGITIIAQTEKERKIKLRIRSAGQKGMAMLAFPAQTSFRYGNSPGKHMGQLTNANWG